MRRRGCPHPPKREWSSLINGIFCTFHASPEQSHLRLQSLMARDQPDSCSSAGRRPAARSKGFPESGFPIITAPLVSGVGQRSQNSGIASQSGPTSSSWLRQRHLFDHPASRGPHHSPGKARWGRTLRLAPGPVRLQSCYFFINLYVPNAHAAVPAIHCTTHHPSAASAAGESFLSTLVAAPPGDLALSRPRPVALVLPKRHPPLRNPDCPGPAGLGRAPG